jgi:ABC-type transporter Mla MlaB component
MPVQASYIERIGRLDVVFEGNLDVSVWLAVCDACKTIPPGLKSCILDLRRVEQVFDSGLALLRMLYQRLGEAEVTVSVLCDHPRIRSQIPLFTGAGWRGNTLACDSACLSQPSLHAKKTGGVNLLRV